MPNYLQLEEQLAENLINSIGTGTVIPGTARPAAVDPGSDTLKALVYGLIDAMPFFGSIDWENAHRGALSNLMAVNMPNNGISPQPDDSGPWYAYYRTSYTYKGPYSGYRDAFFSGLAQSAAASAVLSGVTKVNSGMNGAWWGNYCVTALSDAIRLSLSAGLDTGKLSGDLSAHNSTFMPALSASYLAVFATGYSPTTAALNAITPAQFQQAALILDQGIVSGEFTANINESLAMGGDSATAATWFLFNLWIALSSLGVQDVDTKIAGYQQAGLNVPVQVGPGEWWNGGYTAWFAPISGADFQQLAASGISASMPENTMTMYSGSTFPSYGSTNAGNGYSNSLCFWGSLAWYVPSSGSCFSKDTLVIMADGSHKMMKDIRIGEEVMTDKGARKVVLIEQPKLHGRRLYQINHLQLKVTASHPFLQAAADGPAYAAIDPWGLLDGTPTIGPKGAGKLAVGTLLAGHNGSRHQTISVERITTVEAAQHDDTEVVYDLLLQNWERDHPCYYVGGPDTFLAVEAETADPLYDPLITATVVSSIQMLMDASRESLGNPYIELPAIFNQIDFDDVVNKAKASGRVHAGGKTKERLSIPKPEFYMQNGKWDHHASLLEYYIVKMFGRRIEKALHAGWRHDSLPNYPGGHLMACVYSIELLGDILAGSKNLSIIAEYKAANTHDTKKPDPIVIPMGEKPVWKHHVNETVKLGRLLPSATEGILTLSLTANGSELGQCRIACRHDHQNQPKAAHLLFDKSGAVIGRLFADMTVQTGTDVYLERQAKSNWQKINKESFAVALGKQLAYNTLAGMAAVRSI